MSKKQTDERLSKINSESTKAMSDADSLSGEEQVEPSSQSVEEKVTVADPRQPVSEGRQEKNLIQRFVRWFTKSQPDVGEDQEVGLDYEQVDRRLIGEKPPEPASMQAIRKPQRRVKRQQKAQPGGQIQAEPETLLSRVETGELEEPRLEGLRPTALEEYEPTPGEIRRSSALERLKDWFNQLHTEQKVLLFGSIFVFAAISFFLILVLFKPTQPVIVPPVSNLDSSIPTPAAIILPDNQTFSLSVGAVVDGKWLPQEPEWLLDTEVPRWLSLPWDEELETATLLYERNDALQLQMSNGDILVYRFLSIEEIPLSDLSLFHANTANLLIMLYNPRSSSCLVLVARP